jgi:hypothetical protein
MPVSSNPYSCMQLTGETHTVPPWMRAGDGSADSGRADDDKPLVAVEHGIGEARSVRVESAVWYMC